MHDNANKLQQILQVNAKALRDAIHSSPPSVRDDPAHHCYLVLKIWKEQGHRRYNGDLRSALSKFSVFCGRNPLVLAGVSEHVKNGEHSPNPNDDHSETTQTPITIGLRDDVLQLEQQPENDTCSDEERASIPQKSDRPTLKDLLLLKCRGGRRLRVLDSVAADWKYLATSLGFEGPVIRSIEMGAFFQAEDACHRVFTKWLDGGDGLCEPVTWATLIQCLIDAGLVDIAEQLEEILS